MRSTNLANPFNILVMVAGTFFALTACAYAVMTVREMNPATVVDRDSGLTQWMSDHGFQAMLIQLGFLGVFAVMAIVTDDFWQKRAKARESGETSETGRVEGSEEPNSD